MFQYGFFTGEVASIQQCVELKLNTAGDDYDTVGPADPAQFIEQLQEMISAAANSYIPGNRYTGYFGKWRWTPDPGIVRPEPIALSFEERNAPDNADFFKRQRKGEIIVSPMTRSSGKLSCEPVAIEASKRYDGAVMIDSMDFPNKASIPLKGTNYYPIQFGLRFYRLTLHLKAYTFFGKGWSIPDVDLSFFNDWRSAVVVDKPLVTDLLVNMNESTMDILTELAELPETIGMLRDTLNLFAKKGKRFREIGVEIRDILGGEKSLMKIPDKAADLRLLYRYGILPLTYTVEDINKLMKETFRRLYVKKTLKAQEVGFSHEKVGYRFNGGSSSEVSAFMKRRLDPNSSVQQFQQVFGVNLPKTLWELTPWSLVVDWFVNVGDALTALQVTPSLEEKATFSVRRSVIGTYTSTSNPDVVIRVEFNHYDRIIITPSDNVCLSFNPIITTDRAIDAFAFSWQILRKNIRKLKL